jgi:hypothetical protein
VDYLYESSMTAYLEELKQYTTPKERLEGLLDMVFDTSGTLPHRDGVFWSCYAMGFRNEQIRVKIKELMKKFIEFSMAEIDVWEENGLVDVSNKERGAATLLALSEGFGILRNSVDDMATLKEISQFMKKTALAALKI